MDHSLKQMLKEALGEILHEERGLFHEVFTEALEDFALARAIDKGLRTRSASRRKVFRLLGQEKRR